VIVVEDLRKSIRNGARTVDILKGIHFSVAARDSLSRLWARREAANRRCWGLLAGLDTPSAGEVKLNGTAIS